VAEDEDANEHEADDDDFDLTPEQREQFRTSIENLRRSLAPKFDFTFKLPESTLKVSNSDIFKVPSLAQSNLNLIASQLTRNVDFGLSKSFSRIAEQFAAQQSAWLKSIGPTLERLPAGRPEGARWEVRPRRPAV
jgi:hypothetical protein